MYVGLVPLNRISNIKDEMLYKRREKIFTINSENKFYEE